MFTISLFRLFIYLYYTTAKLAGTVAYVSTAVLIEVRIAFVLALFANVLVPLSITIVKTLY